MISGLLVTITGMDLYARISDRIQSHFEKKQALDARIQRREGDLPFDIRADDGLETLGELQEERDRHRTRFEELSLLRDRLNVDEIYSLGVSDLRAADLMHSNGGNDDSETQVASHELPRPPVDGLKLTIPGTRVRALLDEAIERPVRRQPTGSEKRHEHRKKRRQTSPCYRTRCARTKRSVRNGGWRCSDSFANTWTPPRSIDLANAI